MILMPTKLETEKEVHPLHRLFDELERIVNDPSLNVKQIIRRVAARLQALVRSRPPFLPDGAADHFEQKYGRHLLYRGRNKKFVVMSLVWGPGHGTPVHDHGTWGVAAVYKNVLKVTNYRRLDTTSRNGQGRLRLTHVLNGRAGSISYVLPPKEEIHKMENDTKATTISIHVYGKELKACNTFDLETGEVRRFPLAPAVEYPYL